MKKVGFTRGNVDLCLYRKKSTNSIASIAMNLDDDLMIENPKTADETVEQLKKNGLVLKLMESLQDYLQCEIQFSKEKKKSWLKQLFLIKSLKKKYGE